MTLLCVIPGPTKVLREDEPVERWCFRCRKRTPFVDRVIGDEDPLSYYDPIWTRTCSVCHGDTSLFPGREWSEAS